MVSLALQYDCEQPKSQNAAHAMQKTTQVRHHISLLLVCIVDLLLQRQISCAPIKNRLTEKASFFQKGGTRWGNILGSFAPVVDTSARWPRNSRRVTGNRLGLTNMHHKLNCCAHMQCEWALIFISACSMTFSCWANQTRQSPEVSGDDYKRCVMSAKDSQAILTCGEKRDRASPSLPVEGSSASGGKLRNPNYPKELLADHFTIDRSHCELEAKQYHPSPVFNDAASASSRSKAESAIAKEIQKEKMAALLESFKRRREYANSCLRIKGWDGFPE